MYADTQTQGLVIGGRPWIALDTPSILGDHGYSDTGASHG